LRAQSQRRAGEGKKKMSAKKEKGHSAKEKSANSHIFLPLTHSTGNPVSELKAAHQSCSDNPVLKSCPGISFLAVLS
jgi:hypothetical protein